MKKNLFAAVILAIVRAFAGAVTVEIERLDRDKEFKAITDTSTVLYLEQCKRGQFAPYEWKTWEGYYSARAYVDPIAVITVRRGPQEFFGGNLNPYILAAQGATAKMGGIAFCMVYMRKNQQILEPDHVVFRAYKQFFQAGNDAWIKFFGDIMDKGILLTEADIKSGEKTQEILTGQPKVGASTKTLTEALPPLTPIISTPTISPGFGFSTGTTPAPYSYSTGTIQTPGSLSGSTSPQTSTPQKK